ncbi:hypothetical protein LEP1GSC051_2080 [Leptospira sp. P2653]|nr:hypothetical protein LEP1GSC051_2080 [Leptospira sp. P2653]
MLVVWSSSHVPCKVFDCLPLRREKLRHNAGHVDELSTTLPMGRVVGIGTLLLDIVE